MPVPEKQSCTGRAAGGVRPRSKYGREIALVLLVKLVLIVALKYAFFNDPVKKSEVVGRLDAAFGSQPATSEAGVSSESSRKNK
jgi:hypothetical protein